MEIIELAMLAIRYHGQVDMMLVLSLPLVFVIEQWSGDSQMTSGVRLIPPLDHLMEPSDKMFSSPLPSSPHHYNWFGEARGWLVPSKLISLAFITKEHTCAHPRAKWAWLRWTPIVKVRPPRVVIGCNPCFVDGPLDPIHDPHHEVLAPFCTGERQALGECCRALSEFRLGIDRVIVRIMDICGALIVNVESV